MAPDAGRAGVGIAQAVAWVVPRAAGDAELLQQACTNLVANAIQAMPKGGTVTLSTGRGPDGAVEVRVNDEGVGIPPEDLDRNFRRYCTAKAQGSGTRLPMGYRSIHM